MMLVIFRTGCEAQSPKETVLLWWYVLQICAASHHNSIQPYDPTENCKV